MSGEHLVSECLAEGKMLRLRGLPFCEDEYKEISWASATANVLCRQHNSCLSPVDSAALDFKNALEKIENLQHPSRGEGLWTGATSIRVNGTRFGQWIAKCWCNQLAASGRELPPPFAGFAFGRTGENEVRVFIAPRLGLPLETEWGHFAFLELKKEETGHTVLMEFYGLTWIVSTHDLKGDGRNLMIGDERLVKQSELLERPNAIEVQVPLPHGERATAVSLVFDWPAPVVLA